MAICRHIFNIRTCVQDQLYREIELLQWRRDETRRAESPMVMMRVSEIEKRNEIAENPKRMNGQTWYFGWMCKRRRRNIEENR